MRYFFDTEFIEKPWSLTLISIGVVAEDGREFYLVNNAVQWFYASKWVKENVRPRLDLKGYASIPFSDLASIRHNLIAFVGDDPAPEFWAYYGAHDWVALCGLMGGMLNLPKGWPWLYREMRTALDDACLASFKDEGREDEHNALADARWVRQAHLKLLRS